MLARRQVASHRQPASLFTPRAALAKNKQHQRPVFSRPAWIGTRTAWTSAPNQGPLRTSRLLAAAKALPQTTTHFFKDALLRVNEQGGWSHFPKKKKADTPSSEDKPTDQELESQWKNLKKIKRILEDKKDEFSGDSSSPGGFMGLKPKTWGYIGAGALFMGFLYYVSAEMATEISFQQFSVDLLTRDVVDKIDIVNKEKVRVFLKDRAEGEGAQYFFNIGDVVAFEKTLQDVFRKLGIVADEFPMAIRYTTEINWFKEVLDHSPTIIFVGFLISFLRAAMHRVGPRGKGIGGGPGNIFSIGKSKAKLFSKNDKINVSFKDVAGCNEAKVEIMEFVSFLKTPKIYEELGAKIPKGALLVGPPGTGKTLLAKATAGEAGVPFYSVSGSDFLEMFVGVGPSRVRDLFQQARSNTPCIVFIDEIDAIGRARSTRGSQSNDERENTLNQLLVEMDGFSSSKGIVVLAGTNRPDVLDKALLRPGRFDRTISIDLPDVVARSEIFLVHLAPLKLEKNAEYYHKRLAAMTPGFSGADIANICNEAALIAARHDAKAITYPHFEAAIERVIAGLEKKSRVMAPEEKKIVAYHEAGHAVVSWFLEFGQPLLKVSIIPRGSGALGYAMYMPEERNLYTKDQLTDIICSALGGRAAEEIVFNSITSGASDDLQKVTQIAYNKMLKLGMSETIGPASFGSIQEEGYLTKPYSDTTAELIDKEVRAMVADCYERAKQVIKDNYTAFDKLAQKLLEKEVMTLDDVKEILGQRQWEFNPLHEEYMKLEADVKPKTEEKTA